MLRILADAEATEAYGAELQSLLPGKCLVFLQGQLGAGKTTLVRGFLRAAGYPGNVKSPTFTVVEEYRLATRKVLHFDLYRLADAEELEYIGIRDYLAEDAVCFVEWPEMGRGVLPQADVSLTLTVVPEGRRLEGTAKPPLHLSGEASPDGG